MHLIGKLNELNKDAVRIVSSNKGNIGAAERIVELHGNLSAYNVPKVVSATEQLMWLTSSLDLLPHYPDNALRELIDNLHEWGLPWQIEAKNSSHLSTLFNT